MFKFVKNLNLNINLIVQIRQILDCSLFNSDPVGNKIFEPASQISVRWTDVRGTVAIFLFKRF